jgi:hypothetical protein
MVHIFMLIRSFINCLDDDAKYFTFAHETMHVIEGDPIRLKRGEVDQAVSNIAFDLSINRALSKVIASGLIGAIMYLWRAE